MTNAAFVKNEFNKEGTYVIAVTGQTQEPALSSIFKFLKMRYIFFLKSKLKVLFTFFKQKN